MSEKAHLLGQFQLVQGYALALAQAYATANLDLVWPEWRGEQLGHVVPV